MSVRLMTAVFEANLGSSTDKLVALALADCAADDGTSVYPSLTTLSKKCSLSDRACRLALRRLEAAKILSLEHEANTVRKTRVYRISPDILRSLRRRNDLPGTPEAGAGGPRKLEPRTPEAPSPNPSVEPETTNRQGRTPLVGSDWIDLLNQVAGTRYRPTAASLEHVQARLGEGFTLEDARGVVADRVRRWKGSKQEEYLRPETVFGTKFDAYLQAAKNAAPMGRHPGRQPVSLDDWKDRRTGDVA
jgi:uncharacterized phage protein (TIGR02220 family)